MDAQALGDGGIRGTAVAGGTKPGDDGIATCLDAFSITELIALLHTAKEDCNEDSKKNGSVWRHCCGSEL